MTLYSMKNIEIRFFPPNITSRSKSQNECDTFVEKFLKNKIFRLHNLYL